MEQIIASGNAGMAAREQTSPLESWRKEQYFEVHQKIVACGRIAGENLLQMAQQLKRMRDEKLYEEAGYATFESYTESELNLRKSQAYKYINVLESMGEEYMRENGALGISKMNLLASLSDEERKEVQAAESATVAQLKEQIRLLRSEAEEKDSRIAELEFNQAAEGMTENSTRVENSDAAETAREEAERALAHARETLEESNAKLEKLKSERDALREKLKNQPVKEVENASTAAERDEARAALAEREEEVRRLQKQLQIAGNAVLSEFKVRFAAWQQEGDALFALLGRMNEELREKSRAALAAVLGRWQA